ncbi:unnamed protein product [Arctia plantaginis]|uniref:Uncharacterized protein n=1 Tax=Arctia plantaginis TaxID=874455 RepID=A0A8S1A6X0_ARCPL|nr:unnamed protein product [Arctia plantaginis]
MAGFLFLVLMQFIWSFGPVQAVRGGGAYSYSDSSGHRYSGTYDLKPDGQIVHSSGDPVPFSDTALPGLPPFHDFNRFREEIPSFPRYPNFAMPNFPNSAFASSSLGPGFRRQIAAINPQNPLSNNVNINKVSHFSDSPGRGGYYGVSSKSYASSSNVNGQEYNRRGAITTVDDNGKVTSYKVES